MQQFFDFPISFCQFLRTKCNYFIGLLYFFCQHIYFKFIIVNLTNNLFQALHSLRIGFFFYRHNFIYD